MAEFGTFGSSSSSGGGGGKVGKVLGTIFQIVVVIGAVGAIIYLFVASPHEVIGRSMQPTFFEGQWVLADKITPRFGTLKRSEVVNIQLEGEKSFFIKRIVGLPGETVKIENHNVYVDGKYFDESSYLASTVQTDSGRFIDEGETITLGNDELFLMGDNRPESKDSRDFGPVALDDVTGKVILRVWPLSEFGAYDN